MPIQMLGMKWVVRLGQKRCGVWTETSRRDVGYGTKQAERMKQADGGRQSSRIKDLTSNKSVSGQLITVRVGSAAPAPGPSRYGLSYGGGATCGPNSTSGSGYGGSSGSGSNYTGESFAASMLVPLSVGILYRK